MAEIYCTVIYWGSQFDMLVCSSEQIYRNIHYQKFHHQFIYLHTACPITLFNTTDSQSRSKFDKLLLAKIDFNIFFLLAVLRIKLTRTTRDRNRFEFRSKISKIIVRNKLYTNKLSTLFTLMRFGAVRRTLLTPKLVKTRHWIAHRVASVFAFILQNDLQYLFYKCLI